MRCSYILTKGSKNRKCKRKIKLGSIYCFQHRKMINPEVKSYEEPEYGECCFCGEECNILSQSCGRCARKLTMSVMGMI